MTETVQLLQRLRAGDLTAEGELYRVVYDDLKARAARLMRGQRASHTLQGTALVNEAWLRLTRLENAPWDDRAHFLRTATRAMQSVLVDHARARLTAKRGGDPGREALDEHAATERDSADEILELDDALRRLGELDETLHEVARLRIFGGLGSEDIARLTDCSSRTVERRWNEAREWLQRQLGRAE